MHLARFPRVHLAHLSTPLEPMARLSKELGVELWIKRDDCTGMSTGGNKTRKLEFLMAEALEQGADMVMTQGATQTNHGRQTAAFAAKLGLKCGLKIDRLVHATGSSGTQAGLVTGLCAMNAQIPVLGIGTRAPQPKQEQMVYDLACRTAEKLGCAGVVTREDVMANTDYVGEGYGLPTQSGIEAIQMFAELEGILLDPCYSAKGAAGLIDLARTGAFEGERVVFLHTGGAAALGGYDFAFDHAQRWVTL